ncbi:hypothetical protein Sjap_006329 [Stephania japonica]|uniref:Uncharacterized protein n=1 Tax=Stephania japonica TaxID=461633 RepID=A0AAP0PMP5_9MAGN
MLSLNPPKPFSLFHHHRPLLRHHRTTPKTPKPSPISAIIIPPSSSPTPTNPQVYQPFRPPPSPLPPKYRSLTTDQIIHTLSNRLGLWFDCAPLISTLIRQGFSHSSIEELTGISGVDQNCYVVAAQVRDSLLQSNADPDVLSFYETSGAELLYEIRLLNATQRLRAARFIFVYGLDGKAAQDLARAVKDFPRRRGDPGWDKFSYDSPGDCLGFMYYRQAREHPNPSDKRTGALKQALEVVETEDAKKRLMQELSGEKPDSDGATSVVVLPVCEGVEDVAAAPRECRKEGEFGVVVAEKGWGKWVVLPLWEPLAGVGRGVAVAFPDAGVLPWRVNRRWYREEAVLVVIDRERTQVGDDDDDGFYLVKAGEEKEGKSGFKVESVAKLKELGLLDDECLGKVVLVVRPPKDDLDDQISDEDWE